MNYELLEKAILYLQQAAPLLDEESKRGAEECIQKLDTLLHPEVLFEGVIELAPITKKNSQSIHYNAKTGSRWISQSQQYKVYAHNAQWFLHRDTPIEEPCNVQMRFFMPTKRKVDLSNLQSACLDILVENRVLADDNKDIVCTHDGSAVFLDKERPRTEIVITKIAEKPC